MSETKKPAIIVIFRTISVFCVITFVFQVLSYLAEVPDAEDMNISSKIIHESRLSLGMISLGASISLWWMGEVIALLTRIANGDKGQSFQKPDKKDLGSMIGPARKSMDTDDGEIPKYEL